MRSVVNSWEVEVSTIIFINNRLLQTFHITRLLLQHIKTHLTSQKVQQPAVFYAEKRINECAAMAIACKWRTCQT